MIKKLKDRVVANLPKDVAKDVFAYFTDGLSGVITNIVVRGGKIQEEFAYFVLLFRGSGDFGDLVEN